MVILTENLMGEIYLEPEEEMIKNAKDIAEASKSAEKYVFRIIYEASEKSLVLSEMKRMDCEILNQSDSKRCVIVKISMSQLAAIKTLNCIERVEVVEDEAMVGNVETLVLKNTVKNDIMSIETEAIEQVSLSANGGVSTMSYSGSSYSNSNTMQTAQYLPLSSWVNGCICCPGAEVWYRFTANVSNASEYIIYSSGSLDVVAYLYDSNGNYITQGDDEAGFPNFSITRQLTYGATYYVKVKAYGSNTGNYNIRVGYTTQSSSGGGSGNSGNSNSDYSNDQSSAIQLTLNSWRSDEICCPGADMWYKFTPSTNAYYTIYSSGSLDTVGYLYDANSSQINYNDDAGSGLNFKMVQRLTANQTYYIKVKAYGSNTGYFSVIVSNRVSVESVTIDQSYINLNKGKTANLTATITPSYATNKTLRWESSDTSVVTVEPIDSITCRITAVDRGSATVCAFAQDGSGKSSCCEVTVNVSATVTSVSVTPATKSMCVGNTAYLTATVYPTNAVNKSVTWCSSNPEIVSVDYYSGRITANSVGTAVITATTVYGGFTDTCVVNVKGYENSNDQSTAIELNLNSWQSGEICCPGAETWYKFIPSTTAYYTIYSSGSLDTFGYLYASNGTEIDHDDDQGPGLNFKMVQPLTANQTYYIKVKAYGSNTGYFSVKVSDTVHVGSVTINDEYVTLNKGQTGSLSATVLPTYATNQTLRWESSDTSVVTVEPIDSITCRITAVDRGSASVCAFAQDGSGKSSCCEVTVNVPVESVVMDSTTRILHVGQGGDFSATALPENANNRTLRWTSSKPEVASVEYLTGEVTAKAVGETNIIATAQDGSGKYGVCVLTVEPPIAVQGIDICLDNYTMNVGDTTYLSYDIYPSDATNQNGDKGTVLLSPNPWRFYMFLF